MLIHIYLFLIIFITVSAMVFLSPFMASIDQIVYQMNQEMLSEGHVAWMRQITYLGEGELFIVLAAAAVAFLLFQKRFKAAGLAVLFSIAARGGNPLLKSFFLRDRPLSTVGESATGYSFPSGHSANIAFICLLFYSLLPDNLQQDFRVRFVLATLILLVGISRMVLEVHWMSDVLAGWSFGLFLGLLHLELQRRVES